MNRILVSISLLLKRFFKQKNSVKPKRNDFGPPPVVSEEDFLDYVEKYHSYAFVEVVGELAKAKRPLTQESRVDILYNVLNRHSQPIRVYPFTSKGRIGNVT